MRKMGEISVFPIFLFFFYPVELLFCLSLQHKTNYFLNILHEIWQLTT